MWGWGALSGESQLGNEKALEMLGGPLNCTPKIFKMINFMLRIFATNFFKMEEKILPHTLKLKKQNSGVSTIFPVCSPPLNCLPTTHFFGRELLEFSVKRGAQIWPRTP